MRQRHRGLARDAVTHHTTRKGTLKGLGEHIDKAAPPPPNPNKLNYLATLTVRALTGLGAIPNTGAQSVRVRTATAYVRPPADVVARRRAANKRARIARRAGRS